ncbi:MAG: BatA and WFA domain-containing protein [Gemmataceae bacterium]
MWPLFLYPLAFFGLLGLPALVAIYLFRNRFKRQVVSSLMLWQDPREAREGGRRFRRIQTPLFFLLELLAILLLVFAASDPHMRLSTVARPLVVILDDSISMQAGGEESPRLRAQKALLEEINRHHPYTIRFVLAGEKPQVLGEPVRSAREAQLLLEGWRARAPLARIDEAVALAGELGGDMALLLVLTDHAPPVALPDRGRLQWWAYGSARPNLAVVNAARSGRDGLDRCLLEVANLAREPGSTTVVIDALGDGKILHRQKLDLAADETQRLIVQFPPGTPGVRARIDDDAMTLDNEVFLFSPEEKSVRVDVRVRDRRLREPVEKALGSTRLARVVSAAPQLIISDRDTETDAGSAWVVYFLSEKNATAYSGPFVLDRAHPLMEGLSLRGVIWGAGKEEGLDGGPVVMAGNVSLLSDSETGVAGGPTRHDIRVRLRPDLSTVQGSPDWPILFWNLLHWRGMSLPGLNRVNIRLGEQVVLRLGEYRERIRLDMPSQTSQEVLVKGREVALRGDVVGLHEVRADDTTYRFAVNALNKDESDLRNATTGQWGNWLDDTALRLEYRGIYWILLLGLLAVLVAHLILMARARGADSPAPRG